MFSKIRLKNIRERDSKIFNEIERWLKLYGPFLVINELVLSEREREKI